MSEIGSRVILGDCLEIMKGFKDNQFDLAVVDPPYGISEDGASSHSRGKFAKPTLYTPKNWDKEPPTHKYFEELFRVSKNQIVFGANHFMSRLYIAAPMMKDIDSSCWIVWDKENGENDFADCELAWTSFDSAVRRFNFRWAGMLQGNMKNKEIRVHPTQKPVSLYDWIFVKYSQKGMKILDTHLGSGSSRIAADKAGLYFTGIEIDKEYFDAAEKRYKNYKKQLTIF